MAQSQKVSQLTPKEMYIKSKITEYSPQERDQITVLYFKTADRPHLDYNKMLQEAEQHSNNDSVEELKLYFDNRFADYIASILADYDYYTSKELTPRISEKLIQLYDFKKLNNEITPLDDDDEQEKPVKTREITGKAINIADYPYLAIVDIDIDKKLSEEERNLVRNELLEKIYQSELNVALVKTGHGENETILFKLFSSVNGMKAIANVDLQWINETYNKISQIQGLTIKARSNFDRTRIRFAERSLTGQFNSILSNRAFIVLNELTTFSSSIGHEVDKLKSLITDPTLEIRTKFSSSRVEQNLLNFILVSNHLDPVHLDQDDRRYLFDARIIPMTEAKKEIIEISLMDIDRFCIQYFKQLKVGRLCDEAQRYCTDFFKPGNFRLQIHKNCETIRQHTMKKHLRLYKIKKDKIAELEQYVEDDVNDEIINQINDEQYNT
ncbi:MAG: hypothetical protein EZS28_010967 [Streblomastix strix]|uniref:NrS-1 polymerase-like helicase domain-containing protein n=1 Tax=Streblomastix strix TaxID=222440 RepID=A0A5J4WFU8_9EUKA|nr:MAG: hypothetical protein EZS28_010967 [Streblomastix strix]